MSQFLSKEETEEIAKHPIEKLIDFNLIKKIVFNRTDILNCKITGTAQMPNHLFGKGNIVNCDIIDFTSESMDFDYVDFKDCNIRGTIFSKVSFDYGAIINNVFNDCEFKQSHFHNLSITESRFRNVIFTGCDLKNMIIKGCSFIDCEFINCETSSRLIEESTLFNCRFSETDIQLETIIGNFGLTSRHLINSRIRDGRLSDSNNYLNFEDLQVFLYKADISSLNRLRIAYFLDDQIFIIGHILVDESFFIQNWLNLCKIPSAFTNLIELYLEFLLYEYEYSHLPLYIILKFHDMTSNLVEKIALQNELYKSVMGVHMTLARMVETFLVLLYDQADQIKSRNFSLKVVGPLDITYYQSELAYFLSSGNIEIVDVRKANSPNILVFVWQNLEAVVIFISLFLSTRLKIELSKYYKTEETINPDPQPVLLPVEQGKEKESLHLKELQLFNFDLGLAKIDQKHLYSIKLKSIMPGKLMTTLRLDVSTKFIGKIRDIIVDLIK